MRLASSEGCKGKDCSECFTLYKWGFNACVISCSKTNEAPEKQTMLMRMPKGRDNHRCNFLNNFFIVELKLVVRSIVSCFSFETILRINDCDINAFAMSVCLQLQLRLLRYSDLWLQMPFPDRFCTRQAYYHRL